MEFLSQLGASPNEISRETFYIHAFSRRFYPKRLTVHSGYTCFVSMCVHWELNLQPFALLTQCSTTEPQEHIFYIFYIFYLIPLELNIMLDNPN